MRLTQVLQGYHVQRGHHRGFFRKIAWRKGSKLIVPQEITFSDPRLQVRVEQSGKKVVNAFWNPPWDEQKVFPQWIPERDDPRFEKFVPRPKIESHPLWKDKSAYIYHGSSKLQERMEQAKLLSKSVVISGLPIDVENLVDAFQLKNQDDLIRRYILHAVAWNQMTEPLPKFHPPPDPTDPRKFLTRELFKNKLIRHRGVPYDQQASLLLANLLRICHISNHARSEAQEGAPSLTESLRNRHMVTDCELQTFYRHLEDDLVHLSAKLDSVIYSDKPLPPPANANEVAQTLNYKLPDLWPMKATIDMLPKHLYDNADILTYRKENIPVISHPLYPHTIGISSGEWWDLEDHTPRALMLTFGAALAQARHLYGESVQGDLASPVVIQAIATNGFNFNLITFQLNTVDLASTDGIKNIAWVDSGPENNIREDWRPNTNATKFCEQKPYVLKEYNPEVFKKVLAIYLNGGVQ